MPVKTDEIKVDNPSTKASNVVLLRSVEEKEPPSNTQAEEAIIGALLIDARAIDQVVDILEPKHFYFSKFGIIYNACLELYRENSPVNLFAVADKGASAFSEDFTREDLANIVNNTMSSHSVDLCAQLVFEKWRRRELIKFARRVQEMAHDTSIKNGDLFESVERQLFELSQIKERTETVKASELVWSRMDQLSDQISKGQSAGMKCGYSDIDSYTQGYRPGLILVAGRPSMGKTQFTINTLISMAARHSDKKFLFVSLEMDKNEVSTRLLSPLSRVEMSRINAAALVDEDWSQFVKAYEKLTVNDNLMVCDNAYTLESIRSEARRLSMQGQIGAIAIDYLDFLVHDENNKINEISRIGKGLKRLSKEISAPIFLLSQLNRSVESRTNKRPMLSDLRDSGTLEQDADLVMMLYRDEYYNPQTSSPGIAEVIITKQRNGPTGVVELIFDRPKQLFLNR